MAVNNKEPRTFDDLLALSRAFRKGEIDLSAARQALVFFALNAKDETVYNLVADLFLITERVEDTPEEERHD